MNLADPIIVGLYLFAFSYIGRACLAGNGPHGPLRNVAAQHIVGVLIYSALFALAVHLHLPFLAVMSLLLIAVLAGILISFRCVPESRPELLWRAAAASFLAITLLLCGRIPAGPGPDNAYNAILATTLFHQDWVNDVAFRPGVISTSPHWIRDFMPLGEVIDYLTHINAIPRAPTVSLLWLPTTLGHGISIDQVHQHALWLTVLTILLVADLFTSALKWPLALVAAFGSIGGLSAPILFHAGQIAQPFALLLMVIMCWTYRYLPSLKTTLAMTAVVGFVTAAAYPEFLVITPLYLGCALLLRNLRPRQAVLAISTFAVGVTTDLLTTQLQTAHYMLSQSVTAIEWNPLPSTPRSALDIWSFIVFHNPTWAAPILTISIISLLLLLEHRYIKPPSIRIWSLLSLLCALALVWVWTWAVMRSPTWNYSTLKLAGWIGPGLVVLATAGALRLPLPARKFALAILLAVCVGRAEGLASALISLPQVGSSPGSFEVIERHGRCIVRPQVVEPSVIIHHVAASGAPARNCLIELPVLLMMIPGGNTGWVDSEGISLAVPIGEPKPSHVRLAGSSNFDWLPTIPQSRAVIQQPDGSATPVPSELAVAGNDYQLSIDLTNATILSDSYVKLLVTFTSHFVPSEVGVEAGSSLNSKRLVMHSPRRWEVEREGRVDRLP